jgi:hypothetical protein
MKNKILLFIALIVMIGFSGCATTSTLTSADGTRNSARPLPVLDKTKSIFVTATATNDVYIKEKVLLRDQIITKLREAGYIASSSNSTSSQKVNVNIDYLRDVGGGSRFLLGPLAGSAKVNVTVSVSTAEKKGEFKLDTSAIDWTGFAGTTEQTIYKVAERIAMVIQGQKLE